MNITLTREEVQQVLDALEHAQATEPIWKTPIREAIETLRARLAQPEPSMEPEAYKLWVSREVLFHNGEPIAYREPQREWQGLTSSERKVLWLAANNPTEFGEMLEAKLKEKNT